MARLAARDQLAALGIPSDAAFGNFILFRFASETIADQAEAALKSKGVLVRKVKGYGLPDCLRVTVGDEDSNRLLVATLQAFLKGRTR